MLSFSSFSTSNVCTICTFYMILSLLTSFFKKLCVLTRDQSVPFFSSGSLLMLTESLEQDRSSLGELPSFLWSCVLCGQKLQSAILTGGPLPFGSKLNMPVLKSSGCCAIPKLIARIQLYLAISSVFQDCGTWVTQFVTCICKLAREFHPHPCPRYPKYLRPAVCPDPTDLSDPQTPFLLGTY